MTASPSVLYRTPAVAPAALIGLVLVLLVVGIGIPLTLQLATSTSGILAGLAATLAGSGVLALACAPFALERFVVTSAGVVIRTGLRTHRIGWDEVREIALVPARGRRAGCTVVHRRDGSSVVAAATAPQWALWRSEPLRPRPGEFETWSVPCSAAIDAMRRHGPAATRRA
ncbi:hypothetical protein [Brachybacterium huguangmaarense]